MSYLFEGPISSGMPKSPAFLTSYISRRLPVISGSQSQVLKGESWQLVERLKVLGLFSLVNRFAKLCYVLEKIRVFNFVEMNQVD